MLSKNKDWFRYNSYFRTWERVLLRAGGDYSHQVAVELTAMNGSAKEWIDVGEVKISRRDMRYSGHFPSREITWTHHLPDEVYEDMVKNLGKDKADFLVHADIYKLVDWNEFTKFGSESKLSLHLCRRDLSVNFRAIIIDEFGSREIHLNKHQFSLYGDCSLAPNCDLVAGVAISKDGITTTQLIIYYDHINRHTAIEIKACIPEKEELNTRIVGRHNERWNDRVLNHMGELVTLGYFNEANIGVIREISENAWTLIQSGNI